jgi:transcriptional regulator with XRE-family HTH domain
MLNPADDGQLHNSLETAQKNVQPVETMHYLKTYNDVWNFLVRKVEEKAAEPGMDYSQVARLIGVAPATISRWRKGERGTKVPLLYILQTVERLGVPMEELVAALAPGVAAKLFRALARRPDLVESVLDIIERGSDDDLDKIENDAKFVRSKIKAQK